jgi:hypothetical protein
MSVARVERPRKPEGRARRLADLGPEFPPPEQPTPGALGALQKPEIQKW